MERFWFLDLAFDKLSDSDKEFLHSILFSVPLLKKGKPGYGIEEVEAFMEKLRVSDIDSFLIGNYLIDKFLNGIAEYDKTRRS